jgi:hypothetical protein
VFSRGARIIALVPRIALDMTDGILNVRVLALFCNNVSLAIGIQVRLLVIRLPTVSFIKPEHCTD